MAVAAAAHREDDQAGWQLECLSGTREDVEVVFLLDKA